MKSFAKIFLFAMMLLNVYAFCSFYEQKNQILVYAENYDSEDLVYKLLDKFGVAYKRVHALINSDDKNLYIISGKLSSLVSLPLPRYYILHQTETLTGEIKQEQLLVLLNAVSVWDFSNANIDKYRRASHNYYYLPNINYEHLDPVVLPCFLPVDALSEYQRLLKYSNAVDTDISSLLPALFFHCFMQNPKFIVEAGVRGGESTIALHAAAQLKKALLVGIDIVGCAGAYSKFIDTLFFQMDDTKIELFLQQAPNIPQSIDLVFVDTSHEYIHTMAELAVFVPRLSEQGAIAFHDSNVTPLNDNSGYERINGTSQFGIPGNPRGVTQAIKEFFGLSFNEYAYLNKTFLSHGFEWNIVHYPFCNGLTIVKKMRRI